MSSSTLPRLDLTNPKNRSRGDALIEVSTDVLAPLPANTIAEMKRVEQAQSDHRDQRGPGDDLLRVARLLAVDGRRLETDPRPEREEQPDRHRTGRRRCSERACGQALEGVVEQHRLIEH